MAIDKIDKSPTATELMEKVNQLVDELTALTVSKANINLSNLEASAKTQIGALAMPNFTKQIVVTTKQFKCAYNSFVVIWCNDSYTEDYNIYMGPAQGSVNIMVGRRFDDFNGNTQTTTFSFFCPAGWWVNATSEGETHARVFPIIE